jgi:hypothetical protein
VVVPINAPAAVGREVPASEDAVADAPDRSMDDAPTPDGHVATRDDQDPRDNDRGLPSPATTPDAPIEDPAATPS